MVPQFLSRVGKANSTMVFGTYIYKCFFSGVCISHKVQQGPTRARSPRLSFLFSRASSAPPVASPSSRVSRPRRPVLPLLPGHSKASPGRLAPGPALNWRWAGVQGLGRRVWTRTSQNVVLGRQNNGWTQGSSKTLFFSKSDLGKIPSAKLGTEQSAHGMLKEFDSINAIKYWGCQKQNKLNCK